MRKALFGLAVVAGALAMSTAVTRFFPTRSTRAPFETRYKIISLSPRAAALWIGV